jgi:hypothetical protein
MAADMTHKTHAARAMIRPPYEVRVSDSSFTQPTVQRSPGAISDGGLADRANDFRSNGIYHYESVALLHRPPATAESEQLPLDTA